MAPAAKGSCMQPAEFAAHAALEDTHWWFRARRNIIYAALQRCAPRQRQHLLEIGCGTGGNLRFFASRFGAVTGADASEDAVRYARERVPGEVFQGDFRATLAGRWQNFDVILLADVLEHVADDRAFLTDVVTNMRQGSTLLITVPAHQWLWSSHDAALGHHRRYSAAALRALCSDLPLTPVYRTQFNSLLLPLVLFARALPSKPRAATETDLKEHGPLSNALLYGIFNLETSCIRYGSLPVGCSHLVVLRKA